MHGVLSLSPWKRGGWRGWLRLRSKVNKAELQRLPFNTANAKIIDLVYRERYIYSEIVINTCHHCVGYIFGTCKHGEKSAKYTLSLADSSCPSPWLLGKTTSTPVGRLRCHKLSNPTHGGSWRQPWTRVSFQATFVLGPRE